MTQNLLEKVHPACRDFVAIVEELLSLRRGELERGERSNARFVDGWGPRVWNRTEMEDMVYSSYKQMRRGRITRTPRRNVVMEIADYLNCTVEERNRLLQSADYAPIDIYLTGERLEELLKPAIQIAATTDAPAMVINRDWQIHYLNKAMMVLYNITPEQLQAFPEKQLNGIRVLFDPQMPLYRSLIDNDTSWRRMARQTVYGFKLANRLCQFEDWYQQLVAEWMTLPEFEDIWNTVRTDTLFEQDQSAINQPAAVLLDTAIPGANVAGARSWLRPVLISVGYFQYDFPQILSLLPADEEARLTLLEIGAISS